MYFNITGAIFIGGAGSVIIGGLYWKKATTPAAFTAMIVGSVLAVSSLVVHQIYDDFPINQQWLSLFSMVGGIVVYISVSLLTCKKDFDLNKMLHRGTHTIRDDRAADIVNIPTGWKTLAFSKEFSKGDKVIAVAFIVWILCWWSVFLTGTIYNLTHEVDDFAWTSYWRVYIWISLTVALITTVWFTTGGIYDLKKMFSKLSRSERNDLDDGVVVDHQNLGEEATS